MKIEIKNRFTGDVLFEHEYKNNTIKITLEAAIRVGANLRYANLRGADLSCSDLSCSDLRGANLSDANLRGANLSDANLSYANLRGAVLRGANLSYANLRGAVLRGVNLSYADLSGAVLSYAVLRGANLRGAVLRGAVGNGREVMSAQAGDYLIAYTSDFMWIGCRKHPVKTWWKDSEKEAHTFSESDKKWRAKNKRWIQGMVKNNPATKLEVK